jgi:hypothetical protein
MHKDEWGIVQINFYKNQERLIKVGMDDDMRKINGGRKEFF